MSFQFYNPDLLISQLQEMGINSSSYSVCSGCVLTNIAASDCYHPVDDFSAPNLQSDTFCKHCVITADENNMRFELSEDSTLSERVRELEEILEMASA